jgi:hypothetical protein
VFKNIAADLEIVPLFLQLDIVGEQLCDAVLHLTFKDSRRSEKTDFYFTKRKCIYLQ